MTGIKETPVTRKQVKMLREHMGKDVVLKADRVLGVGRQTVRLVSVDETSGTAQVIVPGWGEETVYLYMFVKLY